MKSTLSLAAAVASALLVSTAAFADSADWTGPYVGLNAGYGFGSSQSRTSTVYTGVGYFATTSVPAIATAGNQHLSLDGFTGGAQVGYNFAIDPNWVLGVEADFEANSLSATSSGGAVYPCCAPTAFTVASRVSTNWLATIRPRVGYAWDDWMVYLDGGLALHDERAAFVFSDTYATAAASGNFKTTRGTWTVGGGVEHKMDANWSWRVEYLYVDYGHIGGTSTNLTAYTPAIAFPSNVFTQTASLNGNVVRVALNYRF